MYAVMAFIVSFVTLFFTILIFLGVLLGLALAAAHLLEAVLGRGLDVPWSGKRRPRR
jgi:hypothetical protein